MVGQAPAQCFHGALSFGGEGEQCGASVGGVGFAPYESGRLQSGGASSDPGAVKANVWGQVRGIARPGSRQAAEDRIGQLVHGLSHADGQALVQLYAGAAFEQQAQGIGDLVSGGVVHLISIACVPHVVGL